MTEADEQKHAKGVICDDDPAFANHMMAEIKVAVEKGLCAHCYMLKHLQLSVTTLVAQIAAESCDDEEMVPSLEKMLGMIDDWVSEGVEEGQKRRGKTVH